MKPGCFFLTLILSSIFITLGRAGELAGYKLLVSSFRTGDPEIFVIDPDSGDAVNLTRSPGSYERYASWSSDGSRITFVSDRDGTFNLYIMDADGGNLRQLTHEKPPVLAGMQSWTMDGKWIYFGLFGRQTVPTQLSGKEALVCRIAPDGSNFEVIGEGIDAAVSPDGARIAFARKLARGHCLFVMNSNGTNVRQLTTQENEWDGVHATWSPDGKRIIYADRVGDALELFGCDPDGTNVKQLTSLGKAATSPAVSPDMKWISFRLCDEIYWRDSAMSKKAYEERKADKRPVWVMGFDGSNPRIIEALHYQTMIDGSRAAWKPR